MDEMEVRPLIRQVHIKGTRCEFLFQLLQREEGKHEEVESCISSSSFSSNDRRSHHGNGR